jgi:hypothetical protein
MSPAAKPELANLFHQTVSVGLVQRVAHFVAHRSASGDSLRNEVAVVQRLSEWARLDSNQGPTDYESAALTS